MPTRKIAGCWACDICRHPEHDPPKYIALKPGVYEHECPSCHEKQVFTVVKPMM